ncbi:MAG: T9SS type A sorting domain-containing protein [Bacteroidaceae bacterium]|nr:T9SS type A sorting domain-containing protein [Bacteroidaceae bacterium]
MKKLLFIISFIAMATVATAQHMVVEMTDSNNQVVKLESLRQITFNGTTVNIEQTDGTKSSTSMGNIGRIYFGDLSSIADINAQSGNLVEYLSADEITINSEAGSTVAIYGLTGVQLLTRRIDTQGEAVSIAGLPQGIYIVKANGRTTKIIKR